MKQTASMLVNCMWKCAMFLYSALAITCLSQSAILIISRSSEMRSESLISSSQVTPHCSIHMTSNSHLNYSYNSSPSIVFMYYWVCLLPVVMTTSSSTTNRHVCCRADLSHQAWQVRVCHSVCLPHNTQALSGQVWRRQGNWTCYWGNPDYNRMLFKLGLFFYSVWL